MDWRLCVVLLSVLALCGAAPKNVLFLDIVGSPSHQVWMHSLARAVANSGDYNVTSLTGKMINHKPENVHVLILDQFYEEIPPEDDINFLEFTQMGPWDTMLMYGGYMGYMDETVMNAEAMKTLINYPKDFKFDLIIYDYMVPTATLAVADRFPEAKLIAASAYPLIEYTDKLTGAPHMTSFANHFFMSEMEDKFTNRLENFLVYSVWDFLVKVVFIPDTEKIISKTFKLKRDLPEIFDSTQIILTNHNPVMDLVAPIMPSVIPVGGLQIETTRPLPEDIEEIYKTAKKGVILFALGSNVKSEELGKANLEEIVGALDQFPEYNIIWKIDLSKVDLELPKNVFIKNWLPQNDILADTRTKLFISHAGGLSTQEATWHGVPVLAIPIMFDQYPNAKAAVKSGMALMLDINNFDRNAMKQQMNELLGNKKYAEAAALRSRNYQDQKERPIERALWWIEFVMRNDDISFLKSSTLKNMNYIAKHSIDVIAFLVFILIGFTFLTIKLICWTFKTKTSQINVKVKKQ